MKKCIDLYITKSIRSIITDRDTGKCKYFKILVVIKVFKKPAFIIWWVNNVAEDCFAIGVVLSTIEPYEMKNSYMDENVIECDNDRQLEFKILLKEQTTATVYRRQNEFELDLLK